MTKVAFNSAQRADKRIAKIQWEELIKILEKNYSIKTLNKDEVYLNIPGEEVADIEILLLPPSNTPFRVQLWNFKLNPLNDDEPHVKRCSSVSETILAIDELIRAYKLQKRHG